MSEAVLLMFFNMKSDERSVNIYRLEIETFEIHLNCHQKISYLLILLQVIRKLYLII